MLKLIDYDRGEDGAPLRAFFIAPYDGSRLPALPWGEDVFDCVLVALNRSAAFNLGETFAAQIVHQNVDWVESIGPDSERIHDLVDQASVRIGRQAKVGDGSPMTTWNSDALTADQMADRAACCLGAADSVLCLVIGSDPDRQSFADRLKARLAQPK